MYRWAVIAAVCVACDGGGDNDNGNDGEVGGHCYPNGTCNVGLHCSAGICLPIDAALIDAFIDAPADAPTDAPPDAFVCLTAFEPNETLQTATATGVAATQMARTLTGLMICPGTDKDFFEVTVTANQNLEVLIDVDGFVGEVHGSILNSGGVPIANASLVSGMPQRRRAYTPNLPTGVYYATVYSSVPTYVNGYQLTLTVTGP